MSVIWDLIQHPEEHKMQKLLGPQAFERRRSSRQSVYVPLFVYGYGEGQEPFHQETNTLQVNANGALLRLDGSAKVHRGQKLLLMNRLTNEEQECQIVMLAKRPKHTDLRVGVAFAKAAPQFWTTRKTNPAKTLAQTCAD